jgi:transposase
VTWRRAQMVLLSAQGMDVPAIAKVTFTSPDRVRDVLHNFNADGFDSLKPRYAGGRPPKFDLAQRAEIRKIALGRPADHGLPFATWSLSKLADFLVAEGVVEDISHEGLRRAEAFSRGGPLSWLYEGGHGPCGGLRLSTPSTASEKARARDLILPVCRPARRNRCRAAGWTAVDH